MPAVDPVPGSERRGAAPRLAAIVAMAIAVRLVFASGLVGFDDLLYIQGAAGLTPGELPKTLNQFVVRSGAVAPMAALFAFFGVNTATAAAVPFACSIVGILAAFAFGRRLFDDASGLVAAAALALFPLDVIFATCASPTTPIGLFAGSAIALFVVAERAPRRATAAAAGAALGVATWFAETPLLVLIAYAVYAATIGRPARHHLAALGGLTGVIALELAFDTWLYGQPLARFATVARQATVHGVNPDVAHAGWNAAWIAQPLLRIATEQELGLYLVIGLPLAAVRLVRSDSRAERTLALFVVVLFAWTSWGSVSPFTYAPLDRLPRYLAVLQLPLMLLLGRWVTRLPRRRAYAVAATVAVTSLACVVADGSRWRMDAIEEAHRLVMRARPARIVLDDALRAPFLFYEQYRPTPPVAVLRRDGAQWRSVALAENGGDDVPLGAPGTYVVAQQPALRKWLAERPRLVRVQRLPAPDSLYRRLLHNPAVRRVLAVGRSQYRLDGLSAAAGDDEAVEIFTAR